MKFLRDLTGFFVGLLFLLLATFGGFRILGPMLMDMDSVSPTPGIGWIEGTATWEVALLEPDEPIPDHPAVSVPTQTSVPTPSSPPTSNAPALPPPIPMPTITASPMPTQMVGGDVAEISPTPATDTPSGDEAARIVVDPTSLTVVEPQGAAAFTISLSREPLAPLTIPLSPSSDECLVSLGEVLLDSNNWREGVAVRVDVVDDEIADGDQACVVDMGPISSTGADYSGLIPNSVTVTVKDNDRAGFFVDPASLTAAEPEGAATFAISLSSEPMAPLTIPLSPSGDECLVSLGEVLLDSSNWRDGVAVRVDVVDDEIADGDQACVVEMGAATSAGYDYDGLIPGIVTVTVQDDDRAGIIAAPASLTAAEPQGTATFTISLGSEPAAPVTIPLNPSNEKCLVSPGEVILDSGNWRAGMAVLVEVVDDLIADGDQSCVVEMGAATSAGADYDGLSAENVTVTVKDDDRVGIVVDPTSLVAAEGQGAVTFTISLGSEPAAPVTIPLNSSNDKCLVSPAEVILDNGNWRAGMAVLVEVVDDLIADGDQSCVVEMGAAGSSGGDYDGLVPENVTVSVKDDDRAEIVVDPTSLTAAEPQGTNTFTISLGSEPVAPVTIPLNASNGECLVSPGEVLLDGSNWRDGVAVSVQAVDDEIADGDQACVVEMGAATSPGDDYEGLVPDSVTVTVEDDDRAQVLVGPTSLAITEPEGSDAFTVRLASEPSASVLISVIPDGQTAISPTQLTFTDQDWHLPQSVAVSVSDDQVAEGQHNSTIRQVVTSSDPNYDGVTPADVIVQITDDDNPGVVVSPAVLRVVEDGVPESYEIVLASQPTAAVVVAIATDAQTEVSPAELTFTDLDWDLPQAVTVTAEDDGAEEEVRDSIIHHTLSSDDGFYSALAISDVTVTVVDRNAPGTVVASTRSESGSAHPGPVDLALPAELDSVATGLGAGPFRLSPPIIFVVALAILGTAAELIFVQRRS